MTFPISKVPQVIALLLMTLHASAAASQEFQCPKVRASKSRAPSYPSHPSGGICEGFYDKDVSQALIEVVSVVAGNPPSSLADVTPSSVMFSSAVPSNVPAMLHIEPLRDVILYRVDAKFQQPLEWKTSTMLEKTQLTLRDLGYLAIVKVGGRQDLVVLPLQFGASTSTPPANAYFTVRVFTTALALRWRTSPLKKSAGGASAWKDANSRPIYGRGLGSRLRCR